jgi:hypothetical protein
MARKKELNNGATCANNKNGKCKLNDGLDCPFRYAEACPDSDAKKIYSPFDGTISILYKWDENKKITHIGFYLKDIKALINNA